MMRRYARALTFVHLLTILVCAVMLLTSPQQESPVCAVDRQQSPDKTAVDQAPPAMTTFDHRHSIEEIQVTLVYFVPKDREALADWRERADYYANRIEKFHERTYGEQSKLNVVVIEKPFVSARTTEELRNGDANFIFFQTTGEVDRTLGKQWRVEKKFPVLLVLSEINWRPLDDMYRVKPEGDKWVFEGNYNGQQHFPGATAGGARAIYYASQRAGLGLVSADGWRVPYRGSDCVVYHEGIGHPVGMPHPPTDRSVMSLAQYHGWINESFITPSQKTTLGWKPGAEPNPELALFSAFTAIPSPLVPSPGQPVRLKLTWPSESGLRVKTLRVRYQTAVRGPWKESDLKSNIDPPSEVELGQFSAPTPVSYRIDVELEDGRKEEIRGYLQVRQQANQPVMPAVPPSKYDQKL